jgi:hypothetical protein
MKHILAALILTGMTCGCTQTETTPGQTSRSTETKEVNNNNKETVKVQQPIIQVKVNPPNQPSTTKTTKVISEPAKQTTTKIQQPAPQTTKSPVAVAEPTAEPSPMGETGFLESQGSVSIAGSNTLKTLDARGRDLTVSGKGNQLTFEGKANSLEISGDNNQISVSNVRSIHLTGRGNHVNWTGDKPQLSDTGSENLVSGP